MVARVITMAVLCVVASLCSPIAYSEDEFPSFLQTGAATAAGLNVSSLSINGGPGKDSVLRFGDGKFALVLNGDTGDFEVRHENQRSFVVTKSGDIQIFGELHSKGAVRIDGPLNFMGVSQWSLAAVEDFTSGAAGWSNDSVTVCGNQNKKLLGGYSKFAGGEVYKTFRGLPPHTTVRLKANYHFIDSWGGETAYAKIENRVMWTDTFDQQSSKIGVNICGGPAPESKFSVPIDITLPHTCSPTDMCTLTITFGSTLTLSPTEQSWGVSDVMILVR